MIKCKVIELPWNEWEWMLESKSITDIDRVKVDIFTNTTSCPSYVLVAAGWAKGWHHGMS